MAEKKFKINYPGSLAWLIFWVLVFFPIALMLFFTNSTFQKGYDLYSFKYNGSRFWLGFWLLAFFPVAFILLFVKGFSVVVEPLPNPLSVDPVI